MKKSTLEETFLTILQEFKYTVLLNLLTFKKEYPFSLLYMLKEHIFFLPKYEILRLLYIFS